MLDTSTQHTDPGLNDAFPVTHRALTLFARIPDREAQGIRRYTLMTNLHTYVVVETGNEDHKMSLMNHNGIEVGSPAVVDRAH